MSKTVASSTVSLVAPEAFHRSKFSSRDEILSRNIRIVSKLNAIVPTSKASALTHPVSVKKGWFGVQRTSVPSENSKVRVSTAIRAEIALTLPIPNAWQTYMPGWIFSIGTSFVGVLTRVPSSKHSSIMIRSNRSSSQARL